MDNFKTGMLTFFQELITNLDAIFRQLGQAEANFLILLKGRPEWDGFIFIVRNPGRDGTGFFFKSGLVRADLFFIFAGPGQKY